MEKPSRNKKFRYNLTRITGTLHEDRYTFFIISRSVLLRMRNVSDTIFEKIKTHILYSVTFFLLSENRAVYEIMWENIVEHDRPQMTIWRMRIAFWIPKATKTNSECVITNAFPLQKSLHERASILRYAGCST